MISVNPGIYNNRSGYNSASNRTFPILEDEAIYDEVPVIFLNI